MDIIRKQMIVNPNNGISVGDQIVVDLTGFGSFTATAQKPTEQGMLFMFDDCVTNHPMNILRSNEGGYEKSDLYEFLNTTLRNAFTEELRNLLIELSIPTYGQMFGHDTLYYKTFEPDSDKRLPFMKKRKNRIADYEDDYEWYWLRNATKGTLSSTYFANVTLYGDVSYSHSSTAGGVRPVFVLSV